MLAENRGGQPSAATRSPRLKDDPYRAIADQVLLYAGNNATAPALAPLSDAVILHGQAGFRLARELQGRSRFLIDSEYYKSDRDDDSGQLLPLTAEESVSQQIAAGVACLLAPSRFSADRSPRAMRRALDDCIEFITTARRTAPDTPAFAPLVIRFDELKSRAWVQLIAEANVPIALIFAAFMDPLGVEEQLRGAIELVQATERIMVLRCDLSVAGLMAFGAMTGAIGSSSSARHLWLPSKKKKGKEPVTPMFLPSTAAWMNELFIRQAQAEPSLGDIFGCSCDVCGHGGDVRNLFATNAPREMLDQHSISAAVRLAQSVSRSQTPRDRWKQICDRAAEIYGRLAALGVPVNAPPMLEAWRRVLS